MLRTSAVLTGHLDTGRGASVNDYAPLANKPRINGVVLISDRSFEDLGDHILTNDEIYEILKAAGI